MELTACHFFPWWPWTSYLTFPRLSFLVYEIEIIVSTPRVVARITWAYHWTNSASISTMLIALQVGRNSVPQGPHARGRQTHLPLQHKVKWAVLLARTQQDRLHLRCFPYGFAEQKPWAGSFRRVHFQKVLLTNRARTHIQWTSVDSLRPLKK